MTHLNFRPVTPAHFPEARALLEGSGLPVADLEPARVWLLGAFDAERLVGTIGLEGALVRSMAVAAEHRGQGVAHQLYERLVEEAVRRGLTTLFTLTQTAEGFFTALGYTRVDRSSVPTQVKASAQFTELCPSSTAVFKSQELNQPPRPPLPLGRGSG